MPKVSVVIPCYNAAQTIVRALDSVRAQTSPPFEVILVDDASTDNTIEVIEQWRERFGSPTLRVLKSPLNRGAAAARNAGWDLAHGDFIAFLDADDSWHPEKLLLQANWLCDNHDVPVCGHAYAVVEETAESATAAPQHASAPHYQNVQYFRFEDFLLKNRLSTPTVILRRDLAERFPEHKRYCEDYDLWLQISYNHGPCAFSTTPLTYLHKRAWGVSGLSGDLWEMYRAELECYQTCCAQGWITKPRQLSLSFLSSLKHMRRVVIKALGATA